MQSHLTDSPEMPDFRVIRRNGNIVGYNPDKIKVAVTKTFLAVEGEEASGSSRIYDITQQLTDVITETFIRRMPQGGTIHIEDIQDQVELTLMRAGEHKVARAYVLYREEHRKARQSAEVINQTTLPKSTLNVTLKDGTQAPLDFTRLGTLVTEACADLAHVDANLILNDIERNLFDGVPIHEVTHALVMTARPLVEQEPNYSYVTARLLMDQLRTEALSFTGIAENATHAEVTELYPSYFRAYIEQGIEHHLLDEKLHQFDLNRLGQALQADRDLQFTYLSLQTLYDRYFLHVKQTRFELPQAFFMRVAMGLALNEDDPNARAIEFYNLLSSFDYMSSTPTLFNSGTLRSQLSSCYLTYVPDDLENIYGAIKDNALLSKWAGGLGNDWTSVRAMGAHIKGTNGKSQGVVPFLKVVNDTAVAVNQGGKRKGAVCAYLETWHLDIEEFVELRKNTGDERRRTHDMNSANWVPDLFLKRVSEDKEWTLFSPDEVPNLHDLYGRAFEDAYEAYEEKAKRGEIRSKTLSATGLWRKMLGMLFETGHPWITFKDACNLRSPQQHAGVVHSSNLCTEITLNTSVDEIAVCNLGSINLIAHIDEHGLNLAKLKHTVTTAVRMLDNVIDINYYAVPQARNSNLKHRPVGLGMMGFQDALYQLGYSYSSEQAVEFADSSMEAVSYFAIEASCNLAKERGHYESYPGSLWDQGILPIDSIALLQEARGEYLQQDTQARMNWDELRQKLKQHGMRNSNVLAIAPTATISNICGVSQSIEPTYQNLFVKSNLSGEFTVVNPYLVRELKTLGLWDKVMVNDLKYFDGSIQRIERIPADLKERYQTAFEIEPRWLIDAASRRQKWIDQSQSLNLYIAEASGKKLDIMYRMAWLRGLKTTYYLRSLGATDTEKSTIHDAKLNAVQKQDDATPLAQVCAIDDPDCEACQ
ncbi:Ribonucleoside-diphosphate reductase 1 subunit alpha [Piscirickettsia salmonis]|nr:Ribonucleoside-diphosphate reductase 1 subunit alpha [Piscirickettsia salmonis]QGP60902.1 Ribonucleoside-diphosphate reductase 1 subunit alpha [Piscirickettsia salmonis]QGP62730.1 Ribonucleoside-diphosphate reductase 1 subunit alpha [Piscirickettsia salmonis]